MNSQKNQTPDVGRGYNTMPDSGHGLNITGYASIPRQKIMLVVMGVTGVGKSSFINVAGGRAVVSEPSLESSTQDVGEHATFVHRGCDIILVDTPGFDNNAKSDMSILDQFIQYLIKKKTEGVQLSGIIYLHRITDVRMGSSAIKNIQLLREICGDPFLSRVTLVTTMWDTVNQQIGMNREEELKTSFWQDILCGGAMYQRHYGTKKTALNIVDGYFHDKLPLAALSSNIEHQVLEEGTPLPQADAGRLILTELHNKFSQLKTRLLDKRKEQKESQWEDRGLEEEASQIQEEIDKLKRELESCDRLLAEYVSGGIEQRMANLEVQPRPSDREPRQSDLDSWLRRPPFTSQTGNRSPQEKPDNTWTFGSRNDDSSQASSQTWMQPNMHQPNPNTEEKRWSRKSKAKKPPPPFNNETGETPPR